MHSQESVGVSGVLSEGNPSMGWSAKRRGLEETGHAYQEVGTEEAHGLEMPLFMSIGRNFFLIMDDLDQ